ncbi:hypothetical protein D3C73_773050 [compost metagenome]
MDFVKKGAPRYDGFVHGLETQYHQGGALTMKFKQKDGQNQRIERISTSQSCSRYRHDEANSCRAGY